MRDAYLYFVHTNCLTNTRLPTHQLRFTPGPFTDSSVTVVLKYTTPPGHARSAQEFRRRTAAEQLPAYCQLPLEERKTEMKVEWRPTRHGPHVQCQVPNHYQSEAQDPSRVDREGRPSVRTKSTIRVARASQLLDPPVWSTALVDTEEVSILKVDSASVCTLAKEGEPLVSLAIGKSDVLNDEIVAGFHVAE